MIYIKNNKISVPVSSVVSAVICDGKEIGKLYYRPTKTRRRVWSGHNRWDLFAFVSSDNNFIGTTSAADGIPLGRYGGVDIQLDVRKVLSPKKMTPMGFETPMVSVSVGSVELVPEFPTFKECRKCLQHLPFHQPGGVGSELEEVNFRDFVIDAQISYFACQHPEDYDPSRAKPEMLQELAYLENRGIYELGTFVPSLDWDGTVPEERVFSLQLLSFDNHVEAGRKFAERFGVEPNPGKLTWKDDVKLKNSQTGLTGGEYEAEIFCSAGPEQLSGVTLFAKDAATAARLEDVLNCLEIQADYSWIVNDHIAFDFLPFSVPMKHGTHRESVEA